jgi:hypothetical protein
LDPAVKQSSDEIDSGNRPGEWADELISMLKNTRKRGSDSTVQIIQLPGCCARKKDAAGHLDLFGISMLKNNEWSTNARSLDDDDKLIPPTAQHGHGARIVVDTKAGRHTNQKGTVLSDTSTVLAASKKLFGAKAARCCSPSGRPLLWKKRCREVRAVDDGIKCQWAAVWNLPQQSARVASSIATGWRFRRTLGVQSAAVRVEASTARVIQLTTEVSTVFWAFYLSD